MLHSGPLLPPDAVQTVTLFIPALIWPHAGSDQDSPDVPLLKALLSRGNASDSRCEDEAAWLCDRFGVDRQADWPSAPICMVGSGRPPGAHFWLSADPVHLKVNRDQLILLPPERLSIDDAEAVSLCAALNRHFAADDFVFQALSPDRWYLRTGRPARIHTHGLSRVAGQDVDRMLPDGEDRLDWHRIFNEIQMLLHTHPVNEAREQRGALPINSLWFSGGGTLPRARTTFSAVAGRSTLVQGLAKLAEIPLRPYSQGIDAINGDDVLVELGDALVAAMRLEHGEWKAALQSLEANWIAPLAGMLKNGRLRRLVIATVADGCSYQWSASRFNLWRWWRPAILPATLPRNI